MTELSDDTLVTVCAACLRANCWQGSFMCEKSSSAGTVEKTVRELRALCLEHPDNWLPELSPLSIEIEITPVAMKSRADLLAEAEIDRRGRNLHNLLLAAEDIERTICAAKVFPQISGFCNVGLSDSQILAFRQAIEGAK